MPPKFKEEWVVKVGKEAFVLSGEQMTILREAMKKGERWVNFDKFILSVPHIESIYLSSRINENQIEAPQENYQPIPNERFEKIKKEAMEKIGRIS
jgi:hypothetical protein